MAPIKLSLRVRHFLRQNFRKFFHSRFPSKYVDFFGSPFSRFFRVPQMAPFLQILFPFPVVSVVSFWEWHSGSSYSFTQQCHLWHQAVEPDRKPRYRSQGHPRPPQKHRRRELPSRKFWHFLVPAHCRIRQPAPSLRCFL